MIKVNELLFCTVCVGALTVSLSSTAYAQQVQQPRPAENGQAPGNGTSALDEIIVTGRVGSVDITKFETSYAISTMDATYIEEKSPISITGLLEDVPGFWAEGSGGVSGGNVFARGIPIPAGYRFNPLLEDGLPVIGDGDVPFTNPDVLSRIDDMTTNVEVVRGGPASIFYSSAPGGAINVITKGGTKEFQGSGKITIGDYGLRRGDFTASGPLAENMTFAVGGFYRVDNGVRNPGFKANEGGQIRGSLTYTDDDWDLTLRAKYLNDRNIFYLPIPLARNADGSVSGLPGINPHYGTMVSNDFRNFTLVSERGSIQADLQDGSHPKYATFDLEFNKDLGDGWSLKDRARIGDGTLQLSSIFSVFDPQNANNFLAGQLARARAVDPTVQSLALRFVNSGQTLIGPDQINALNGNGLIQESGWLFIDSKIREFINDFQINKTISGHDIVIGYYYDHLDFDQTWIWNNFLHGVKSRPSALDVIALDAAGNEIAGTQLTRGGVINPTFLPKDATMAMTQNAFYVSDNWQISDALRIDAGARYQINEYEGLVGNKSQRDLDGNPRTLFDIGMFPNGTFTPVDEELDAFAWTIGINYELSKQFAIFGRYTSSEALPSMRDAYDNSRFDGEFQISKIKQAEAGVKARFDTSFGDFNAFVVGFYNSFTPAVFALTVAGQTDATAFAIDTKGTGIEWELNYKLRPVGLGFDLRGVYQDPHYDGVPQGVGITNDPSGNQIIRNPKFMLNVRPYYELLTHNSESLLRSLKLYASVTHVGDRYADLANVALLPAYTTIDAGLSVGLASNIDLLLVVSNLNNSSGLQEGNPRTDTIQGQRTPIFQGRPILGRAVTASIGISF
ncbi:TonB-dependent siderophore receptor [Sphingomonas oleivorans]|nr:TonB-dependent receptor [Sphingomonas oleivorans]